MHSTTKGALAAGAATVLLLGGAGTLAFWTAENDADGGEIVSGTLTLAEGDCGDDWVYATGAAGAGTTVDLFVPGDVVTRTCTFAIGATGDNLAATVDTPNEVDFTSGATTLQITNVATYAITGGDDPRDILDGGTITDADDGSELEVTFNATIPFGTDEDADPIINGNDTQDITASLGELAVTLTQQNPNG